MECSLILLIAFLPLCGHRTSLKSSYPILPCMLVTYMFMKRYENVQRMLRNKAEFVLVIWCFISDLWWALRPIVLSSRVLTWQTFSLHYVWGTFKKTSLTCSTGIQFSLSLAGFHRLGAAGETLPFRWSMSVSCLWIRVPDLGRDLCSCAYGVMEAVK